ncbi:tetratricopeptide repeat protein [Thalassolituus sp. LLYu03]|uniref:tetratricopeptide repeat protein n=1 Tax=Thalassolituus sp. LLYu03 TaxID=3421656 RepID=UPI003D2AB74A
MNKVGFALLLPLLLSSCSLFAPAKEDQNTLGAIPLLKVRLLSNDPLETSHEDVINRYQKYLDVATDPEMRVRVSHRIANLKLQEEEQELSLTDEVSESAASTREERAAAMTAIRDYENLLQSFPDRTDNDAILYQLAKAYSLAGRMQMTIATLEQLVTEFPRSEYYLESEFRLGQLLYASSDYEAAEAAYQRLRLYGADGNQYYISAGYLKGWAIFKQDRLEDSLVAFTELLDEQYPDTKALTGATGGDLDMLNDILRIMAIMFDDMGDWEQIAQFFDAHGKRHYEYLVYDRLATLYYDKQYYKSGASTLRAFVLRYPDDVLAPSYYERLIAGYQKARYPDLARKHKEIYNTMFGVGTPYWNTHTDAMRDQLTKTLSGYIWDLAGFWHAWGQGAKKSTDKQERLTEAERWYIEYIRSFPAADDTVKAHFLLAEVATELNQYPLAKDHYEIVAYQYPAYEKAAEAGYAAILSFNKYRPAKAESLAWRQATVASALRFVQEFPQDTRTGVVLVNTAEMLLKDKYYSQALTTSRLAWAAEGQLDERYRYGAALVRGHASFELEEYAESEQALLEAQGYSRISRKEKQELREKVAAAIYKQGELAKAQGDFPGAVVHWRRLASVIPESDTRISAEYDAATLLMENHDYDQAIEVLLKFRADYPEHRLTKDIPSKLIVAYEDKGEWRKAAFELQRIWADGTDPEQQRVACFQAAEYFEKAGDKDNAVTMYKRYAHSYKKPFDAAIEAHFKLDQIYAAEGDEEKRRFWLDQIITLHSKAGKEQTDRSRYLASKAAYDLGEFERGRYEKIALTLPLDKSVTRKNAAMQAALKRYTQAVQIGSLEYTTSSTFRIGELYKQLSQALMKSERPAGMDDVEAEEYQFLLEEQAFPLDEAAIEIHQTNVGRTYDGLYDQWIKQSYRSLGELMPGQYNKQEKAVTYVDQIR